jgi:hypothetical protein
MCIVSSAATAVGAPPAVNAIAMIMVGSKSQKIFFMFQSSFERR